MRYFYFILLFIFVLNCKSNNSFTDESSKFFDFPASEKLELSFLNEIFEISVDGLLNYKDSLLLIRNAANTSKFHFTAFDLNKDTTEFDILQAGRQDNQSLTFLSYGIHNDKLWVYDIVKNKIITSDIEGDKTEDGLLDKTISTFYYGIQPLSDTTFLGIGDYDSNYRAAIVDTRTDKIVKQLDSYPKNMSRGYKMAYESFLYLKPTRDKAVLAARFTDRVQILDLETENSLVLNGPDNFEPNVEFMIGNDGKEISYSNEQSKYAFVKGVTTNNFIYLLYSGNYQNGPNRHYGKIIYVYSWEGKPLKKLLLPDYILDFIITSDDSAIYTFNPNNRFLEYSKLNL